MQRMQALGQELVQVPLLRQLLAEKLLLPVQANTLDNDQKILKML